MVNGPILCHFCRWTFVGFLHFVIGHIPYHRIVSDIFLTSCFCLYWTQKLSIDMIAWSQKWGQICFFLKNSYNQQKIQHAQLRKQSKIIFKNLVFPCCSHKVFNGFQYVPRSIPNNITLYPIFFAQISTI